VKEEEQLKSYTPRSTLFLNFGKHLWNSSYK